jgi:hypothetical protein
VSDWGKNCKNDSRKMMAAMNLHFSTITPGKREAETTRDCAINIMGSSHNRLVLLVAPRQIGHSERSEESGMFRDPSLRSE